MSDRTQWTPEDIAPQPMIQYSSWVTDESFGRRHAGYVRLGCQAGPRGIERVVPPGGDEYAYDRVLWARTVEVSVSPTGRSARVWVDGREVPADTPPTVAITDELCQALAGLVGPIDVDDVRRLLTEYAGRP